MREFSRFKIFYKKLEQECQTGTLAFCLASIYIELDYIELDYIELDYIELDYIE